MEFLYYLKILRLQSKIYRHIKEVTCIYNILRKKTHSYIPVTFKSCSPLYSIINKSYIHVINSSHASVLDIVKLLQFKTIRVKQFDLSNLCWNTLQLFFSDPNCKDSYRNCLVVVQARLCNYSYYKKICCASCSKEKH